MAKPTVAIRVPGELYDRLLEIADKRDVTITQALDIHIRQYQARVEADIDRLKAQVEREVKGAVAKQLEAIHDAGAKAKPKPEAKPEPWSWDKAGGGKLNRCGRCGKIVAKKLMGKHPGLCQK